MYYPLDTHMVPEQREILAAAARLWDIQGPLLREQDELAGGMQWRTVDGVEYLNRYRPDPAGRSRKITKSLGRRSPATEGLHSDFAARRDQVTLDLDAIAPRIAMIARAARSMGVARLDRLHAERLHRLRRAGLLDPADPILLPLGAPALAAYEATYGTLAKETALRDHDGDDALTMYVRHHGRDGGDLGLRVARALFTAKIEAHVDHRPGCIAISTADRNDLLVREVDLVFLEGVDLVMDARGVPRSARLAVHDALKAPIMQAVVPASDGIQGFPVPSPRTYAMMSRLAAAAGSRPERDDLAAFRRGSFVAWSIREGVMPPAFSHDHEAALASLGMPNPLLGFDPSFNALLEERGTKTHVSFAEASVESLEGEEAGRSVRGP